MDLPDHSIDPVTLDTAAPPPERAEAAPGAPSRPAPAPGPAPAAADPSAAAAAATQEGLSPELERAAVLGDERPGGDASAADGRPPIDARERQMAGAMGVAGSGIATPRPDPPDVQEYDGRDPLDRVASAEVGNELLGTEDDGDDEIEDDDRERP